MYSALTTSVERMASADLSAHGVIAWACPVLFFGDLAVARVATVGINPSNREFLDVDGVELHGTAQRLPTLESLGLFRWAHADARHLREIALACRRYFRHNPYDRWFGVLEQVLAPAGMSFYGPVPSACHLDLVPYATLEKWSGLTSAERDALLQASSDILGLLLRESHIDVLVLNGRSVVRQFEQLSPGRLEEKAISDWQLTRRGAPLVPGIAYRGTVSAIGNVALGRTVRILGYNHNLQSSFGVTAAVKAKISSWLRTEQVGGRAPA